MRIKRFVAKGLPQALALIKDEFGLDAVILSQREHPQSGEVEVTAGVREEDLQRLRNPAATPEPPLELPPQSPGRGKIEAKGVKLAAAPSPAPMKASSPAQAQAPAQIKLQAPGKAKTSLNASPRPGAIPGHGAEKEISPPSRGQGALAARDLKPALASVPLRGVGAYKEDKSFGLEKEISTLRLEMEDRFAEIRTMLLDLAHRQMLSERWRDRGDLVRLYRGLLGTGLTAENARDFVEMAAQSLEAWGGTLLEQLKGTVRPMVKCLSPQRAVPRLLSAMGPSGAGKSSTIMRLSAFLKQKGKKVALISLDTLKLGAAEQLTKFARIMGLGLKVSQSRKEFLEARDLFGSYDHVLVDTSTRDFQGGSRRVELTQALSESGAVNLLVLPAPMKFEDLSSSYESHSGPLLWGTVLTKLDETKTLGNVFNFIRSFGPLFAYFSNGHKAPEDFIEAKADKLIDLWLSSVI